MKKLKQRKVDLKFLAVLATLLATGIAMLYSASTAQSFEKFGNTTYYFFHQLFYGLLPGLLIMYAASKIDYQLWQKYLPLILVVSLVLLTLVKAPLIGVEIKGASRWVDLGIFTFQPSELAKLAIVLYLASWFKRKEKGLNSFLKDLLPALCVIGLFSALILWQPDMGTSLVVLGTSVAMLFAGGVRLRHFLPMVGAGIAFLLLLVKLEPYRVQRIITLFDPSVDPQGISYQINQAVMAIGAGGLWGYGYGLSRQKHNYLPEVLGDSVFAVVSEELGFLRIILVIGLFALLAYFGLKIAKNTSDIFGRMAVTGIVFWVSIQALVNIAAMLHLIPLTGIPLPFFSYGSSSLVVLLFAMGIVLNISRVRENN